MKAGCRFARQAAALTGLLAFASISGTAQGAERKPNLVLILADDFGYECVTANGGESYSTPHLDRLAATGMRFERCYVQPSCTPTRVELMTGLYNVRNYRAFGRIDPQVTTFAHLLKEAGYATAIAGKWQLGPEPDLPQRLGFDEAYLHHHIRERPRAPRYANPGLEHNGEPIDFNNGEYGPTLVNDFALDFAARHRDRPFLLYYSMILTHVPFQPTPDSPEWNPTTKGEGLQNNLKHFADMTAYMDKMIGRLVAKLEELGLRDNTLLVFVGDNGTHKSVTSQFKGDPYPGGKFGSGARATHVPLIANWPGRIPSGRVNSDLIAAVDFLPTLCEAAGARIAPSLQIDGRSFLPRLLGRKGQPREWLYSRYDRLRGRPEPVSEFAVFECAMNKQYKLYRDGRFFDLRADPFEEKPPLRVSNLSGGAAKSAEKLQSVLDQYANVRPAHLLQPAARDRWNP